MTVDRFAPVRRVVLAYALVSFLWILLSDWAVEGLFHGAEAHQMVQTWKGWFFVAVTTALLYWILMRLYGRLIESTDEQLSIASREARTAALLQALAETSSDAIFAKDPDGRYLLFNREAARLMGKSQGQVLGHDDHMLFPPEQAAQVQANDRRVMGLGRAEAFEELLETCDGPRTFLTTKGPLRDGEGVIGTFGVSRDITEMVAARQRLQDGERRYRLMFERNPQPMMVFNRSTHRFLAVNDTATRHYGFSHEAFLSMSLDDIWPQEPPLHKGSVLAGHREADDPVSVGPLVHHTADGRLLEVKVSFCDIDVEAVPARLMLVHDVTEQNRLARERDNALAQLNEVISRVTDGFLAVNSEQYLTYVNHQAAALIEPGTEPQALVGRLVWDLIPGAVDTRYADAFFSAMADGRSVLVEDWFEPWQRWIEARIYPSSRGASVYFTDISERKRAEQALERSQKDLSALAASLMSQERETNRRIAQTLHDQLGQQLSSARLYLDVIQSTLVDAQPVSPELVSKALSLLAGAITEVRHVLLELRPPLLEEQGLAAALDNELRNSPAGGLGMQLALEMRAEVRDLRWPDTVEYAVFMVTREAIANALQHAQARSVSVALDGDAGFLCLRVEDDGVGIAADVREGLLGHLGIVGMRERAQAVGGRLAVGPRAGGGTVVEMTIDGLAP